MTEEEEAMPEHKQFLNERAEKLQAISMRLIAQTSLDAQLSDEDQEIQALIALRTIHLGWLQLRSIENLEVFEHLKVLYLQHNRIARIEGLEHLHNLQYLALNNNQVVAVENLRGLRRLQGLNLSDNCIEELDPQQLPSELAVLALKNNPLCLNVDYRAQLLGWLRSLETLDDQPITPAQRFKLLGLFPPGLTSYAAQMNHFRTKKELGSRFGEEGPVLLNTENVNEKDVLGEVREKTRKYLHQNEETFKRDKGEMGAMFAERIAVSRKIREIKQQEEKDRLRRIEEIKASTLDRLSLSRQ